MLDDGIFSKEVWDSVKESCERDGTDINQIAHLDHVLTIHAAAIAKELIEKLKEKVKGETSNE